VFILGFALGMGSTLALYTTEIVPAAGLGIVFGFKWLVSTLVGKLMPILMGEFEA
jgi:hypothetical protein